MSAPTKSPHFPPELTDRILPFIRDTKTLQDCALVSKEWLPASRILVQDIEPSWISLSVADRTDIERIEDFVVLLKSRYSSVAKYTKRVSLLGLGKQPGIPAVPDICSAFTSAGIQLTHIEFDGAVSDDSKHFDPLRLLAMSAQTMRVLVIKSRFMEEFLPFRSELINIVASCALLEHVQVPESLVVDPAPALDGLPVAPGTVRSVRITADLSLRYMIQPAQLFLTWLIGHADPTSQLLELDISGARGSAPLFDHIKQAPAFAARVAVLNFRLTANAEAPSGLIDFQNLINVHSLNVSLGSLDSTSGFTQLLHSLRTLPASKLRSISLKQAKFRAPLSTIYPSLDEHLATFVKWLPANVSFQLELVFSNFSPEPYYTVDFPRLSEIGGEGVGAKIEFATLHDGFRVGMSVRRDGLQTS